MDEQGKKIIKKIKDEHIKHTPKFVFKTKNVFFWLLFVICLLLISTITTVIIVRISHAMQYIPRYVDDKDSIFFIIKAMSTIWLLILIVSAFVTYFSIRHTKHGYRYPSIALGLILFIVFIFLTMGHFIAKTDGRIVQFMERSRLVKPIPFLDKEYWSNSDKGYLEGTIISVQTAPKNVIMLEEEDHKHHSKKTWIVYLDENTRIHPLLTLEEGTRIKMLGIKKNEHSFYSYLVIPYKRYTIEDITQFCQEKPTDEDIQMCINEIKNTLKQAPPHIEEFMRDHHKKPKHHRKKKDRKK